MRTCSEDAFVFSSTMQVDARLGTEKFAAQSTETNPI